MGYTYKCTVSVNGFLLFSHTAAYEETCVNRCRRYMNEFQRKVANIPMRVEVFHKEKSIQPWLDGEKPYVFKKALIRKPLKKKGEGDIAAEDPEE